VRPILFLCFMLIGCLTMTAGDLRGFEGRTDVGRVHLPGSAQYDSAGDVYRITGSGENMWGSSDAFFFLWRKVNGDVTMKTTVGWAGEGKNPHRKAGWMLRAGLQPDAPYVDIVQHGDGLVSLQCRKVKSGKTSEIQFPLRGAATFVLERHGEQTSASVISRDGSEHPIGTITIQLEGDLYAGLAVCSHDSTVSEEALFSDVRFNETARVADDKRVIESTLEVLDISSGVRTIVRRAKEHFEAPNWSRDGKQLYYNSGGKLFTLPVEGGTPTPLPTRFADKCNNDHGLSPNGKELAISHHGKGGKSLIYVLPSTGGEPRQVTSLGPSYWHGWSPDGKTLAYCAERNGEFDVYTIPVSGGEEKRLTTATGLDDGPDYAPDGKYIYFNSVRTGQMKIWRMNADGSEQRQFTPNGDFGDWFAHPAPDGKWIVFLSYDKSVEGHPANKDVVLRIMPASGGEPKIVVTLFGGQGTINVPSWSPDSRKFAFVSYGLVAP
jgi:TolB protein